MKPGFWTQFRILFIEQTAGIRLGDFLIIILLAALLTFIPGYIMHIKRGTSFGRIFHVYITFLYIGVMLLFTIIRRKAGSRSGRIVTDFDFGMTFSGIYSRMQVIYCLMNVVLFIPFGLFWGLFRKKESFMKIIIMTMLLGFISSLCIEVTQHITKTGVFEVTDLATNVAGTVIGAFLAALSTCIFRVIRNYNNEKR